MIKLLILCAVGRLCIFLLQKFPFHKLLLIGKWWQEKGFLHDLFACDLCLGVWVYTMLLCVADINIFQEYFYVPIISEFIMGGMVSFLVHLIRVGFEADFSVIKVG